MNNSAPYKQTQNNSTHTRVKVIKTNKHAATCKACLMARMFLSMMVTAELPRLQCFIREAFKLVWKQPASNQVQQQLVPDGTIRSA